MLLQFCFNNIMQSIAIGQNTLVSLIHWYYDSQVADFEMF